MTLKPPSLEGKGELTDPAGIGTASSRGLGTV